MAISLSSIAKGQRLKPPKITMYGVGGIGKTSFAASSPKPIFIMTEEGQGKLDIERFEIREGDPVVKSFQEILDCVEALHTQEHTYRTVVLDTLDFSENMLWKHTADKYGKADIEAFGYGKGYTYALDEFRVLLDGLDTLRNEKGMIIIILAHCDIKKFDSPDSDSYDRYKLNVRDNLGALVHDWSDAMLFVNYRSHIIKEDKVFNKQKKRAVGMGERVVYTEARPAWQAKNRYDLPPELILPKVNPWLVLQNAIVAANSAVIQTEGNK